MDSLKDRIEKLKEEIRKTPYHKGTEHYIGRLRARIARLEDQLLSKPKGGSGSGRSFAIKKAGDATVVLIGPTSVGKSTFLNKLTNASSKVASYAFTTTTVIPGMMNYKGAKIQILDLPGIIEEASKGRGRGREILSVARSADLITIMTDIERVDKLSSIINELTNAGLRINQTRPKVIIKKKGAGGVKIRLPDFSPNLNVKLVSSIAAEFRLANAEIIVNEDLTLDRLIDAFSESRVYTRAIYVVNKIDLDNGTRILEMPDINKFSPLQLISAEKNIGIDSLKSTIWENLQLIRVYLKKAGEEADLISPIILKKGATVGNLAQKISSDMTDELKEARIWGPGTAYPGQTVGINFLLRDGQVVTLH